ncbi:MAG: META domain-containing protein [Bacteroidales bacterium]|nr:META domain-containing protein [Bacteroidales bacterium]
MKNIIQIVILGLLLGGCKTPSKIESRDPQTRTTVQQLPDITEKHWRLIEINGKPVASFGQTGRYSAFFLLSREDNRVTGNTGCNTLTGTFEIDPARYLIKFLEMSTTLMACLNMEIEDELNRVFRLADNYSITADGRFLSLNQAQTALLARFQIIAQE